jgi:Ca2+-binding RTX toxin-like protein
MAHVFGTDSSETIDGADGVTDDNDFIQAFGGDDVIFGFGGDDRIKGGGGADAIFGGGGIDTVSYLDSQEGVWVSLVDGGQLGDDATGDVFTSIENLQGSNFGDLLVGDDGPNVLEGLDGNDTLDGRGGPDTLYGGSGNDHMLGGGSNDVLDGGSGADNLSGGDGPDILNGGTGVDRLTGGSGADTFRWKSTADAGTTFVTADFVSDFERSEGDLLDLSIIDADATVVGNQSFEFIGREAFTAPGQVRWFLSNDDRTFIVLNTDNDSVREMMIEVAGQPFLEADWFIL